jgi:hypothetical protein
VVVRGSCILPRGAGDEEVGAVRPPVVPRSRPKEKFSPDRSIGSSFFVIGTVETGENRRKPRSEALCAWESIVEDLGIDERRLCRE